MEIYSKFITYFILLPLVFIVSKCEEVNSDTYLFTQEECVFGDWSEWSACTQTCGNGAQRKRLQYFDLPGAIRKLLQLQARADSEVEVDFKTRLDDLKNFCSGAIEEFEYCSLPPCGIDCKLSVWSNWSACLCPSESQKRSRQVVQPPNDYGTPCDKTLTEWRPCDILCPIDCQLTHWSVWSECNATCGNSYAWRHRDIKQDPMYGGKLCQGKMTEMRQCPTQPCPREESPCFDRPDGVYPDPVLDCSRRYLACTAEGAKLLYCPEDLRFDRRQNKCLHSANVTECPKEAGIVEEQQENEYSDKKILVLQIATVLGLLAIMLLVFGFAAKIINRNN